MQKFNSFPFFIVLSVFISACSHSSGEKQTDKPYLIVLSMDGFRWDYTDKADTPNLDKFLESGTKAERMVPAFPTKTFPNHYTMATGLYPDHHGIVLNSFYDPANDRHYAVRDRNAVSDGSFYGGEPIWVTAEKQGMKSASLFWVGSEAEIGGVRPSIWKKYQHNMPYEDRIDTVIAWLEKPADVRPHLIMWYFDEPDGIGHAAGPDSPEARQTVQYLDSLVGVTMNKLSQLEIADEINFIITSDHGMGNISEDKVVMLNEHLDASWIADIQGGNPNWNILAAEGFDDDIEEALQDVEGLNWWRSENVPERLNYGSNPRTLDFTLVADSSWSLFYDKKGSYFGGTHGFDNANQDMHTILMASGPGFRDDGYVGPVCRNVSLYPLMCEVLGLTPAKHDGDLKEVENMLLK